MTKLKPIIYNGDRYFAHTRDDIKVLVTAYNLAVQTINELTDRVKKLESEVLNGKHD